MEVLHELLYPPEHPYHWPVIGYMDDIATATLEDVEGFLRRYYIPNNAVLTLAGDFDPPAALREIDTWFGDIPPGPPPESVAAPLALLAPPRRQVLPDDVQLARVYLGFRGPAFGEPDWYTADLLAGVLTGGRSSPIYDDLVYRRQIARDVGAMILPTELAASFVITATGRPGVPAEELETALVGHLRRAATQALAPEGIERARNRVLTAFYSRASDGRPQGRPSVAANHIFRRAREAAGRGRPVPAAYRRRSGRLRGGAAGHCRPGDGGSGTARGGSLSVADRRAVDRSGPPGPDQPRTFVFPKFQRTALAPGLELWAAPQRRLPLVQLELLACGGAQHDPLGAPGLASLTATLLDAGDAAAQRPRDRRPRGGLRRVPRDRRRLGLLPRVTRAAVAPLANRPRSAGGAGDRAHVPGRGGGACSAPPPL